MKNPDRRAANCMCILLRQRQIAPAIWGVGPENASANGSDGGKFVRPVLCDLPSTVAAQGKPSQVEALWVAVKLLHAGVQGGNRHLHHLRIGPVMMLKRNLGHDYDKWPPVGMRANRRG